MNIVLPADGWTVEGNVITIESNGNLDRYTLPRGQRRITTGTLSRGRKQLIIGGFKSITVTVCGPTATIEQLREAVL